MIRRDPSAVEQWSAALSSAKKLIDSGKTAAARVALEELISFVNQNWGPHDSKLIKPWRMMAESHKLEHALLDPNNGSEVACLNRALAIARYNLDGVHTEVDREVAALAGEVGAALVRCGSIDEGCALMSECVGIATRIGELKYFHVYCALIGHARMRQGRPHEALGFYEQDVAECERNGPLSIRLAGSRFQLANCLRELGRPKDALVQLELALRTATAAGADFFFFVVDIKREIERTSREP